MPDPHCHPLLFLVPSNIVRSKQQPYGGELDVTGLAVHGHI